MYKYVQKLKNYIILGYNMNNIYPCPDGPTREMSFSTIFFYLVIYTIIWIAVFNACLFWKVRLHNGDVQAALVDIQDAIQSLPTAALYFVRLSSLPLNFVYVPAAVIVIVVMCIVSSRYKMMVMTYISAGACSIESVIIFKLAEYFNSNIDELFFSFLSSFMYEQASFVVKNCSVHEEHKIQQWLILLLGNNNQAIFMFEPSVLDTVVDSFSHKISPLKMVNSLKLNCDDRVLKAIIKLHPESLPLYNFVNCVNLSRLRGEKKSISRLPNELLQMLGEFIGI